MLYFNCLIRLMAGANNETLQKESQSHFFRIERIIFMFVFKCKNCGKDIEFVRGKRIVVCASCGKKQTIESTENGRPTFFSETEVSKDTKSDADKYAVYSMGRSLMK